MLTGLLWPLPASQLPDHMQPDGPVHCFEPLLRDCGCHLFYRCVGGAGGLGSVEQGQDRAKHLGTLQENLLQVVVLLCQAQYVGLQLFAG